MKLRLSILPPLLTLFLLFGVSIRPASAHASLLQSSPEANATLDRPPVQVELYFSEAIEPGFSTIEVLDGNGKRVDNDDAEVDAADATRMTASLRSMPDGVYTVSWRALSAVDSHITAGAFPFAVGEVDAAALEAAATASSQIKLSPGEVFARWLTFLSVMTLVGGMFFILIVWQPAVKQINLGAPIEPPWARLAKIALLTLLVANVLWLLVQAGQVSGQEFAAPWNPVLGQVLFTTRFGALWLARLALALLLLWLLPRAGSGWGCWVSLAAGLLLLLTITLGSHAAAQPEPLLPILSDWLHLAAASVWVGGLIHFVAGLLAIRSLASTDRTFQPAVLTAVLIPRFSSLALVSVSLILLTGTYASLIHVGSIDGLINTTYGRTLLLKLVLIIPMLLLGAVNLLRTSPGMKRAASNAGSDGRPVGRFRGLVTSEMILGAAVLLTVGVLTSLSPARVATSAPVLSGEQQADDLNISLAVTPGRPGLNAFVVEVDADRDSLNAINEVSLQFTPASGDLPPIQTLLKEVTPGKYEVEGGFLALPDIWQLQVAVRRDNAFDAFANFDFNVGLSAAAGQGASAQAFPWHRMIGVLLLVAGVLYLLALNQLVPDKAGRFVYGLAPAAALLVLGLVVFLNPPGEARASLVNPIPPNANSIAIGAELYQQNCVPCHGLTGAGDGPVGRTLNPPPADLTLHTAPGVHPDGRLYDWITSGFPDSVMPAFASQLTDEERWHLVNYIRTLSQP